MKNRPLLITAAVFAFSAWPVCAQENAPEPPRPEAPRTEAPPPRPEADRPVAPHDSEARPPMQRRDFREERAWRDERAPRDFDRRPEMREEERGAGYDRPPQAQFPGGRDFRREDLQRPHERAEEPRADRRYDEESPRFAPPRREMEFGVRPPRSRMWERPMRDDFDGFRPHHRRVMEGYGFAPRRDDAREFRDEREMRRPLPPPPFRPPFDRFGPPRGPAFDWDRADRQESRPNFAPGYRGGEGPRFEPRGEFSEPREFHRGPGEPYREHPPQREWNENRRSDFDR